METFNHCLKYLLPFLYWGIITFIYHVSKISVMQNRLRNGSGLANRIMFYLGGTGVTIALTVAIGNEWTKDDELINIGLFILIWLPMILGLRSGYKVPFEECIENAKSNRYL